MRPALVFRAALLLSALVFAGLEPRAVGQTITEFPVPMAGSILNAIATGPDGALWFGDSGSGKIGRITTAGVISEFPINVFPESITAGPDGNLWTANIAGPCIGRITTAGVSTALEGRITFCWGIAAGPDGNLWFTEQPGAIPPGDYVGHIGRITTAGHVSEFPIPTHRTGASVIVAGPDSALWFLESPAPKIGRITTAGVITEFNIPTPGGIPFCLAAGPDGALWFSEDGGIGRMTTGGVVTYFPVFRAFGDIATGSDGALWFTENNAIGRMTTAGVVTEFFIPTASAFVRRITAGPDGALWFTESGFVNGSPKIGRITTTRAPVIALRVLPVVGSTPGANGTFFKTSVQLHNPGSTPIAGQIVFHASGTSGSNSDPALSYSLAPGQTQSIADLLPAMFRSGLGSADIEVTSGSSPVATVRVFNDAGAAGTTGFTEEAIRPEEALSAGARGVLLLPPDLTAFRFNLGVRTLELGASIALTLRDAAGGVVATVPRVFPATYHLQQTATDFLTGVTPPPGGSITVEIVSGSAIVYGATVDNITGDPSLQIARAAP
jgi:streptogramin lyase